MKMISNERYDKMVRETSPGSPILKDMVMSFIVGGTVCTLGQLLCNFYVMMGLELKLARTAVSFSLILAAAVLTIAGVYDRMAKHAGTGLVVPITGFGNSVVACGIEFKSEGLVLGVGAKIFTIAGPVIVYGLGASVIYGLVLYIMKLISG